MIIRKLVDISTIAANVFALLGSEWWSANRIARFQEARLVTQLRYAVQQVPYYRDLGISAREIRGIADLQRFPKITKAVVQREAERLKNPRVVAGRVFRSTTSGSSGEPTTTWFDRRCWLLSKFALKIRRMVAAGSPFGQRLLIFDEKRAADGGVPPPKSIHYGLFRETRLSVFTPLEEQVAALISLRPTAIYGSPSGVKELCDHAGKRGLALPRVRTIYLASELIGNDVRRRIEAALGGAVVGIYGSTELKEVAHECAHGRYHINFESVYVETESEAGQASPRLLLTSLVNKAMPLIRFDIGDYAKLGADACACGRESPYLIDIAGRQAEFLELVDGRRISPYLLTTAIEMTPGLVKYQFVQKAGGGLELNAVLAEELGARDDALGVLRERLLAALGDNVEIHVRRVESISRTAAGKHKIVVPAPADVGALT